MKFFTRLRNAHPREALTKVTKHKRYKKVVTFIQRKPFTSFFAALGLFLLILILGSVIAALQKKEPTKPNLVKAVRTYTIGKTPTVTLQAQVQKNGVIQIVAQSSGIVDQIHVSEGDQVKEGQWLVSLSTNYQGGSAPALQAQLAGAQLRNAKDTYGLQKDIIGKQRSIATASAENTEQLRQISDKSLGDTRGLIDLNQNMLDSLITTITDLEQNGDPQNLLPGLKAQQVQLQAGVNQLKSSVRTVEYQVNTNNPPTTLSNTQKDLALKQLDLQEKALDLNKQVSGIQYNLALVQEGIMHPSAPFSGTVQRVNVQVGQNVSSGDVIATLAGSNVTTTAILRAPQQIAGSISRAEPSIFHTKGKAISVTPSYVSTVATDGQLYSIIYNIPQGSETSLTNGQYISVDVPVGYAATNGVVSYVPIDSVYESQNESTLYLLENKKAVSRKVSIGDVYGEYVEVTDGLHSGDQIILDRNVVAGDSVKTN